MPSTQPNWAYAATDPYDDHRAQLDGLDPMVKQALDASAEDLGQKLDQVPDIDFALVMHVRDQDGEKTTLRKYACVDEGNVAQSVYYLVKNAHLLPEKAAQVAAENLFRAALDFGLSVPEELKKLAGVENPDPGTNHVYLLDREVEQELTEVKLASVRLQTDDDGGVLLKTAADVDAAIEVWYDQGHLVDCWGRREAAQKIAHAASSLGKRIPAELGKYAGEHYAPDLGAAIVVRLSQLVPDEDSSEEDLQKIAQAGHAYRDLYARQSQLSPMEFASELEEIDEMAKMAAKSGGKVPNAVYSTFASEAPKGEGIVFEHGVHRVTADDLRALAEVNHSTVSQQFGPAIAEAFAKDPLTIFNSMPMPQKIVFARMASQNAETPGVRSTLV